MITIAAFLVALGILVAIHEYGHFQVARWCGVKVLRFAIGFGKPLLRWKGKGSDTEFALCMLPLGGYVKMLDEREGEVDPAERHLAFNTQPVWKRFLIVAAGPVANLLLATAIYTGISWYGVQQAQPVVAEPPAQSLAAQAGLRSGDRVVEWRRASAADWQKVVSLEELTGNVMYAAIDKEDVALRVQAASGKEERTLFIPLHLLKPGQEANESLGKEIGVGMPFTPPVIARVTPAGPAARAGMQDNDVVKSINGQSVLDGAHLQRLIQADLSGKPQNWQIERAGQAVALQVAPAIEQVGDKKIAKIDVQLAFVPATMLVRYGFFEGMAQGLQKVWEVSAISVKGFAKMLTGQLSVKNLSGPVTIATFAGRSAQAGLGAYLVFLGLISVSLGVLNLLPVPVLDGGHLMYYLWEAVTGKPVSDVWDVRFKKAGLALLGCMMAIAMFNDISRTFR